ncbi:MAG TPA: alkaline phosphatase family protein [Jatrophihabitans sp.]|uniref:alkaline phosphatase family protein n=1 Tax=Jatrophihabitans sp. TaxID=1932789 RepID=UPI002F0EE8CF
MVPSRARTGGAITARTRGLAVLLTAVLASSACGGGGSGQASGDQAEGSQRPPSASAPANSPTEASSPAARPAAGVPRFDHIVVVVEENHAYTDIIGRSRAPFLNSLAARGALLTQSYGVTYPSQPNYLAMFSGSTQGVTSNSCPHSFTAPNLASALMAAGLTFIGYSEDLPAAGFTGCDSGDYVRKHNPWVNFTNLPGSVNQPMTAFPSDFNRLPHVSFVVPNLENDMHDGSVAQGDRWLQEHLGEYADWSITHNSLLIVTADEDDKDHGNRIATIIVGAHVKPGRYSTRIDHYGLLATLLASHRLTPFGAAAQAAPLTGVWTG